MPQLPDKPSEFLSLALNDLIKCEQEGYIIDMRYFLFVDEKCHVCLAGSLLVQTLQVDWHSFAAPLQFSPFQSGKITNGTARKLRAIDMFRCGGISAGLSWADFEMPSDLPDVIEICPYEESPEFFKRDIVGRFYFLLSETRQNSRPAYFVRGQLKPASRGHFKTSLFRKFLMGGRAHQQSRS